MSTTHQEDGQHCAAGEPLVSVIIPAYNAGESLGTAVQSVLRQTISDFEIIIVDDGSQDDSADVAERFATEDARILVFRHPWNRGQAAARNVALDQARGTWIALLDADDEFAPDRLRTLCRLGEAGAADFIADGVEFTGPRKAGTPARLAVGNESAGELRALTVEALIKSDIPLNGLVSFGYLKPIMRRAFLDHWNLRYDENLRFAEDINLYARALVRGARFLLHPAFYYAYNQTPVSASRGVRILPEVADHALVNNRQMRELIRMAGCAHLEALVDEHEQRWSTVLWFNRLKLALRQGRIGAVLQLTLDCPSGPRGVLRFARDRARVKREGEVSST